MNDELPQGWIWAKMLDFLDYEGGSQPPKKEFIYEPRRGYVRLVQIRDFGDKPFPTYVPDSKRLKKVTRDDLLLARYGGSSGSDSLGRICTGLEGAYNVALAKVIFPRDLFETDYVKYLFLGPWFREKVSQNSRSCQTGFNREDVEDIEFPIAPHAEQRRIVTKLGTVLGQVDTCQRRLAKISALLKRFRQSVLAAACSGRLTADWRDARKQGDEWPIRNLSELGSVTGGVTKNTKRQTLRLQVPYLRVANVYENRLELGEVLKIGVTPQEFERTQLVKDDLLFVEGNGSLDQIGRVALWDGSVARCVHQNHLIKFRAGKDLVPGYVLLQMMAPEGRSQLMEKATSSAGLNTLSISKISEINLPVPSLAEQQEIVRRVESLFTLADRIEARFAEARRRVNSIIQSILVKAFRGELVPTEYELAKAEGRSFESAEELLKRIKGDGGAETEGKRHAGHGEKRSAGVR